MRGIWGLMILLAAFAGSMSVAAAQSRVALVIGNAAYDARLGPLPNPGRDATLMADALRLSGFQVEVGIDLDQKDMKRAIMRLGDRIRAAGPNATGLFFYAGHGMQSRGVNYLAPIGAAIEKEADIEIEAIAADTVLRQIEDAGALTSIVVLDACRNTPILRSSRSAERGLARMIAPRGSYVAYSTAPGETAADGNGRNSPYVTALVREIVKPGLDIELAFRNVRRTVVAETQGKQTPWDSSSLIDPFYFRPAGAAPVAVAAPTEPTAIRGATAGGGTGGACVHCPGLLPVTVAAGRTLYFGRTEVTRAQWQACVDGGKCPAISWDSPNPQLPATQLSWDDANGYAAWLSDLSGRAYRLPTAEEWLAAVQRDLPARASLPWASRLRAVDKGSAGPSGLIDMVGNVAEWTSTCASSCADHLAIGASVHDDAALATVPRHVYPSTGKGDALGFRVVSDQGGQ